MSDAAVVDIPAKRCAGVCVHTSMKDAQKDCLALWGEFMPKMGEMTGSSYGISINMEENGSLDYWAAMELPQGAPVPSGLEEISLAAGKYARYAAKNLASLGEAYCFLYNEWEKTQSAYSVNYQAACFELYPENWGENDPIDLYVPLTAR